MSLSQTRTTLALVAGDRAIYPGVGPCLIGRVEKRLVDARVVMFYRLIALDGSRGELFIPVEKAEPIGVRLMINESEIPKLLAQLRKKPAIADNWRQRATDNSKLLTSGSAFDLAEIVASLTELGETRSLTVTDSRTLERARRLLICEISEVMAESKTAVEEQVDHALRERIEERRHVGASAAAATH